MGLDAGDDRWIIRKSMKGEYLDADTERDLARAWRDNRDERALHRLINAYSRLSVSSARKFVRYGLPMNDLIQEANLGLMKAAQKFDPELDIRFSTYAIWWIRASIQEYVMRNWSMVRVGSTSSQKSLFFNINRVKSRLQREGHLDQDRILEMIAIEMGVPLKDVRMMEGRMQGGDFSLNAPLSKEDDGADWIDSLEDEGPDASGIIADRHGDARLMEWLSEALTFLNEREAYIVRNRTLSDEPRTLDDLAQEFGLSKERIRQVEVIAINKIKDKLGKHASEIRELLA